MDQFASPADRDEVSPFIRMLWEKGAAHGTEHHGWHRSAGLRPVRHCHMGTEKERLTTEAMERRDPLIYAGRIIADDLVGEPDLLRWAGHGYVAGDIKSGAAEEGREDLSKPKVHYAVQLALYVDILERKGVSAGRTPFIIDINGEEFVYDLEEAIGHRNPTTLWAEYQSALAETRAIASRQVETLAAYGAVCKLCWWYSACTRVEQVDDLTTRCCRSLAEGSVT